MSGSGNWMPLAGGVILIAVLGYFGFQGIDGFGLAQKAGTAVLTGKEHVPSKKTYRTDYIAGRPRVIPQFAPEMYLMKLRLAGDETSAAVDRAVFDAVNSGDQVAITYQQTRLTGKLQITSVRPEVR